MYNVKLTKIQSSHENLRTDFVIGHCQELPFPGKRFQMVSEPIDKNFDVRLIDTSPVEELLIGGFFVTKNSTYQLEILNVDSN